MSIYDLLAEAQQEMQNPPLNGVAQISNARSYRYALLADVEASVKPPLLKRGIFLSQGINDGRLDTYVHKGDEHVLLDSRPVLCDGKPQDNGKAETYAKRYALCSVFCIVGDEDDDAQGVDAAPRKPAEEPMDELKLAKKRLWDAVGKDEETVNLILGVEHPEEPAWYDAAGRLWVSIVSYSSRHDGDPKKLLEGVRKRSTYAETPAFYAQVKEEFDSE